MTAAENMAGRALTRTMLAVLAKAASRERGNVCPIIAKVHGCAEDAVLRALHQRGLIDNYNTPFITDAGRAALASTKAVQS